MAAGLRITDVLNNNSKAGQDESPKARFRTKDVSIFKMYRNKENFYDINDIEDLAAKILISGLMENLGIVYAPCEEGEYRLIQGERRWEALKLLVSKGYSEFEIATCQIRAQTTKQEEKIELIISNSHRVKSTREMLEEAQALKENLEYLRDNKIPIKGYDLSKGRLRDIVASILSTNKTKIGQIDNINKNLIPEFLEETKKNRITFSAADQLAGMEKEDQEKLYEHYKETGSITYTEVKQEKEEETQIPGQMEVEEYIEESEEEPTQEDEGQQDFNPEPDCITSKCYSCTNWDICSEKGATIKYCKDFKDRNTPEKQSDREQETEANRIEITSGSQPIKEESATPTESEQRVHEVKLAKMFYQDEYTGAKPFTLRKNDRDYRPGDILLNREYDNGEYTGNSFKALITSMLQDYTGLTEGYCILGIKTIKEES